MLVASRNATKVLGEAAIVQIILLVVRDVAPSPYQTARAHSELALRDHRAERGGDGGVESEDIFLSDLERYPAGGAVTCRDEGDLVVSAGVSQKDRGDVHRVGDRVVANVHLQRADDEVARVGI